MKFDHRNSIVAAAFLILAAVVLPVAAWLFNAESLGAAILTASVTVLLAGATLIFQTTTVEFARLAQRPSLVVDRNKIEKERVILIENRDQKVACNVYIGSFLFSEDGSEHTILYDEIAPALVNGYPVAQVTFCSMTSVIRFATKIRTDTVRVCESD